MAQTTQTTRVAEERSRQVETETDVRWRAVVSRDPLADGRFFYSVRTTGVYCRPSCPSRRANPVHVRFHATAADARAAGFRPCRRCRPDEPSVSAVHAALVAEACRAIDAARRVPVLRDLAARAGLNPRGFERVFRDVTGMTPRGYAHARRADWLRTVLCSSSTVTEAIYEAGFESSSRFYATAGEALGMPPRVYRAGGAHMTITFGAGPCSLGTVLAGRTDRGVCAVLLGDDGNLLVEELQRRFPKARLVRGDVSFEATLRQVTSLIDAPGRGQSLPVDLHGTIFQCRVWRALQQIPAGTTITYGELAARIGAPSAVRAVAGACGANPVAVAVPCHRVVSRDGSLTGYRWGVDRKRRLIEKEKAGR